MAYLEDKRLHETINFLGLRAQATVVGLVQLVRELEAARVLAPEAVTRIKDAIAADLALARPRAVKPEEFDRSLRERLDALFAGTEPVGTGNASRLAGQMDGLD